MIDGRPNWQDKERVLRTDDGVIGTVASAGHLFRVAWDDGLISYYDRSYPSNVQRTSRDSSEPVPKTTFLKSYYQSSNGDDWSLSTDRSSVLHQPNRDSGGKATIITVEVFLKQAPPGPQHTALRAVLDGRSDY